MNVKIVVLAIIGGVLASILTGLIDSTPAMLVGATWYGYPLAWLFRQIVAPEYFPWVVDITNLIADIIFWTMILSAVILTSELLRKKLS